MNSVCQSCKGTNIKKEKEYGTMFVKCLNKQCAEVWVEKEPIKPIQFSFDEIDFDFLNTNKLMFDRGDK